MTTPQLVPRAGIKSEGGIEEDDNYADDDDGEASLEGASDDEASLEGASDDEASLEGAGDDEASLEGAVCHLSVLLFQGMSKRQAAIQTDTRSPDSCLKFPGSGARSPD